MKTLTASCLPRSVQRLAVSGSAMERATCIFNIHRRLQRDGFTRCLSKLSSASPALRAELRPSPRPGNPSADWASCCVPFGASRSRQRSSWRDKQHFRSRDPYFSPRIRTPGHHPIKASIRFPRTRKSQGGNKLPLRGSKIGFRFSPLASLKSLACPVNQ